MSDLPADLTIPGWFWAFLVSGMFVGALSVLSPRRADSRAGADIFGVSFMALLLLLAVSAVPAKAADYADQGAAYAGCKAAETAYPHEGYSRAPDSCVEVFSATGRLEYQCYVSWQGGSTYRYGCGVLSGVNDQGSHTFPTGANCLSRPEQTGWQASSQQVCFNGCTYHLYEDPGTGQSYYSTFKAGAPTSGGVCQVSDYPPPEIDTDGDGVPDDEDAFPNDPNESQDSDGDGIGDNSDTAPDDPTNGDDDGEGNESDNSAGGGGTCDAPPSCEGDGIACNTNFQTWKTRCAVEGMGGKVTGDPTNCNAGYTCENNAVACAQVAVMRAQLCSGTGDGEPGPGSVTGGGNCETPYVCTNGDPIACASLREQHKLRCDITSNSGDDEWGFEGEPGEYFGVSESDSGAIDGIDADGWLNRGQCPLNTGAISALNLPGNAVDLTCGSLSALGLLILMLGWVHAGMIVGRAMSGSS